MDESGFEHETIRPYGYAPIGKPCIDSYNWQGKKRTNVIGALYQKVLFALEFIEKNVNWRVIYDWCKYKLIPSLKTKCVIVMDNASFHKNRRIAKLLNRHGHRILWLPPYSPDLNPIENKWAQVKFLRQGWIENDLSKLFYDIHPNHNSFKVSWLYKATAKWSLLYDQLEYIGKYQHLHSSEDEQDSYKKSYQNSFNLHTADSKAQATSITLNDNEIETQHGDS